MEREKLSLSQSQMSLLTGIPVDTIRSIENGRILAPGLFTAADLVHALDGNLDQWIAKSKHKK